MARKKTVAEKARKGKRKKVGRGKQMTFFQAEGKLAKCCDRVLDARDNLQKAISEKQAADAEFLATLHTDGKTGVTHNGRTYSFRTISERESVAITGEK